MPARFGTMATVHSAQESVGTMAQLQARLAAAEGEVLVRPGRARSTRTAEIHRPFQRAEPPSAAPQAASARPRAGAAAAVAEDEAADAFAEAARKLMRDPAKQGYGRRPQGMPERRKR